MQNPILALLVDENLDIKEEVLNQIIPDFLTDTPEQKRAYIYRTLATMKLDDAFINHHIEYLDLETVMKHSDISEECFVENLGDFAREFHELLIEDKDPDLFNLFLANPEISSQTKEAMILTMIRAFNFLGVETESLDTFLEVINSNPSAVSPEFIIENSGERGYMLLTVAMNNGIFSQAELFHNIDKIPFDEMCGAFQMFIEDKENFHSAVSIETIAALVSMKVGNEAGINEEYSENNE
jgi:succinate dehydrogenase flavin-adding protein (antitoxin of CptAB toxin-antitoxin module)